MSTMILGSLALARTQYDEIRPKALSKAELLELFALLYDVTMPLAYVEAVEGVFGHIKACSYLPGHVGKCTSTTALSLAPTFSNATLTVNEAQ